MYIIGPILRKYQEMLHNGTIVMKTDWISVEEASLIKDNRKPNKQIKDKNKKIRG